MKKVLLAAVLSTFTATAFAQDATSTCKAQAAEKNLAGASLKSFMTRCEKDAKTTCTAQAAERKLAGAVKTNVIRKCVRDAVGT